MPTGGMRALLSPGHEPPGWPAKGTGAVELKRRRTFLFGVPGGRACPFSMDFTKEDIVERFARGDKERTSEGNGLGLAIVSTYAKALGGEFDIRIYCDQFKACLEFEL